MRLNFFFFWSRFTLTCAEDDRFLRLGSIAVFLPLLLQPTVSDIHTRAKRKKRKEKNLAFLSPFLIHTSIDISISRREMSSGKRKEERRKKRRISATIYSVLSGSLLGTLFDLCMLYMYKDVELYIVWYGIGGAWRSQSLNLSHREGSG